MRVALLLCLLSLLSLVAARAGFPSRESASGVEAQLKKKPQYRGRMKFHFINMSHQDWGWIKVNRELFYGYNLQAYPEYGVQNILDGMINMLSEKEKVNFSQVEVGFLEWWWKERSPVRHQRLMKLIESG